MTKKQAQEKAQRRNLRNMQKAVHTAHEAHRNCKFKKTLHWSVNQAGVITVTSENTKGEYITSYLELIITAIPFVDVA